MTDQQDFVAIARDVAIAWLANPHTRATPDDVGVVLTSIHAAVRDIADRKVQPVAEQPIEPPEKPAVSPKASLKIVGRIISMIDGKPYASLTRHLKTHGLTPDAYRARFGLPLSYPMVAPAYSEARRVIAKTSGLGRKPDVTTVPSAKQGRKSAGEKAAVARVRRG